MTERQYNDLSLEQLRDYLRKHRQDTQALSELVYRLRGREPKFVLKFDATEEEYQSKFEQVLRDQPPGQGQE